MLKRPVRTVVLACLLATTLYRVSDLVSLQVNKCASAIYDVAYGVKARLMDMTSGMRSEEIVAEDEQIARDIQETEALIEQMEATPGSEGRVRVLRAELGELLQRRQRALAGKKEQLLAIDAERLEAEKYFLVKLRSHAAKEEWKSLAKIARIEKTLAQHMTDAQQEQAATAVRDFIHAITRLDVEEARQLSTPELRPQLTLARIRSMRRNAPDDLASGFELKRTTDPARLEVWAGTRLGTLLAVRDTWLFEQAWR